VFSKLFKRKSVPNKDGKAGSETIEKQQYVKVYELELSNMEDTPVYALKHQLTVGSEIGNIIIADPSVSPRHATFIIQQEVVSVIDHGSVSGTLINGKKIEPGKYIILEETDVINVGDLEIKLKTSNEAVPLEEIPEPPEEEEEEQKPTKAPTKETIQNKKEKIAFNAREHLNKNAKKKKPIVLTTVYSANSLVRVFAVLSDLLLSYVILEVFLPFDEFKAFLDFIPAEISNLLGVEWANLWSTLMQDYGFVAEMLEDGYQFFSSTFQFIPLLITFILLRLLTTFLFGVSFSEYALGIRYSGNGIWARIGGALRVIVGIFTWPFIIFDIPSIVSRRTLKEFITFTNITVPSKFIAILGVILYIPMLIALVFVSPLLQGLEPPEPILVNDRVDQRVKVKVVDPNAAAEVESPKITDRSETLDFELTYDSKSVSIFPNYKFQGQKAKLNLSTSLMFYQKDSQRTVEFEVFKNFDFKQLLSIGMKNNIMLFDKYPQIYNYVYEPVDANPALKKTRNPKAESAFSNEFIQFTKTALSIGAENALEIMQDQTFMIKGLVDFKASFLSLIEYKDFDQIGFQRIGNITFMKITYNKQKPFDLIIPLIRGPGKIFKVTYDKKENLGTISTKFYKFDLEKSDWMPEHSQRIAEVMTSFEVFDLFNSSNFKTKLMSPEKAQALYAYYFETSQAVVNGGDSVELGIWKSKIKLLLKLLESIPSKPVSEGEIDPKDKILQNFRDLSDALENNNLEYLGISQNVTV
jgi:uncharacterized protein YqgC (DUF456 family)